jgi:hypothetical protein
MHGVIYGDLNMFDIITTVSDLSTLRSRLWKEASRKEISYGKSEKNVIAFWTI